MDFARKQLEKYGWTDGKGLGKFENGIAQALKPKLKRSVAGVGHDAASDFTEHWWAQLYDKAAGNLLVEEKNGKTKKIKRCDESNFEITNSMWKLNNKSKKSNENLYISNFVKTAVLTNGGSNIEKMIESESEDEMNESKDATKMTDEELFAACEGRTAHKGARYGLRALGKLARIEQQEKMLLMLPKYKGYSQAKNLNEEILAGEEQLGELSLNRDDEFSEVPKKKKKRKHCNDSENIALINSKKIHQNSLEVRETIDVIAKKKKKKSSKEKSINEENEKQIDCDEIAKNESDCKKSKKHKKSKNIDILNDNIHEQIHNTICKNFTTEVDATEHTKSSKKSKKSQKDSNKSQPGDKITLESKKIKKSRKKTVSLEIVGE